MTNNRRDFLKKIGCLGGAGLIASSHLNAALADDSESEDAEHDRSFVINILQTTDVHCQVHPHDELFWENDKALFRKCGGYAHLATYFQKERKNNPHTFIIDTGDMFQGSELSVKTTGKAMVPILNELGYNLYLPGNWEVVYYKQAMQMLLGSLQAPKVCANMFHDPGNGKRGELIYQPYHIWNVKGLKIGFIGYTDPLVPIRQSPNYSKGIIYSKPEENLAHYVDTLRNQEQCSFVILLSHLGLSQQINLANMEACKGVDYIFGGDTHERVRIPIQCNYAKVVEPGAFGSFVGKLQLTVKDGTIISDTYSLEEIDSQKYSPSKKINSIIQNDEAPFSEDIYAIAGYSTIPLYRYFVIENPIDTLVLDALHWKLPQVDVVLSNGFRFCPPRVTPDETGNIPITNGYIYDMLPVNSTIRTAKATGKQLTEWLEKELNNVFASNAAERIGGWVIKFKGMQIEFNAFGEKGGRVKKITIGNAPVYPDKTYVICACERDGDPVDMLCRIKNVANAKNTPHTLHSVVKEYLLNNSPVTPVPPLNAKVLDAPQTLLTQVTGVPYIFR
jgi:sulfur-oxidizing protein SoxB